MRLAWTAGQSNDALADETFTFLSNALRQTTILCLHKPRVYERLPEFPDLRGLSRFHFCND